MIDVKGVTITHVSIDFISSDIPNPCFNTGGGIRFFYVKTIRFL